MKKSILTVAAFWIFMLAQLANAQDKDGLSVGFVALSSQSAYTSSATNRLLPSLRYQSGPLSIGLPDGIKYRFAQNERISGAVALKALVAPYNSGDADQLSGMKRDMGFDAGITADFTIVRGTTLSIALAQSIGGQDRGQSLRFALRQFVPGLGFPVFFTAGAQMLDQKRGNYRFGVGTNEATADRAAYDVKSASLPFIGLNAIYPLNDRWSMIANAAQTFLPDIVQKSPIVKTSRVSSLMLGVSYRF